ncbi:MAG: DUF2793 domain-containing protein, partial [Rhodobacteraceae bacterium]|nr:DUF2793 domain-containing protein [Paracoccaceae bacterium]
MTKTTAFGMDHLDMSVAGREETINEGLSLIDALLTRSVEDATLTAPPVAPGEGLIWAVPAAASGAWADQDGNIAFFIGGGWKFQPVPQGLAFVDKENGGETSSTGTDWAASASGSVSGSFETVVCDNTVNSYEFAIPAGCDVASISGVDLEFSSSTIVGIQLSTDGGVTWVNGTYDYRVVRISASVDSAWGEAYMPAYYDAQSSGACFKGRMEALRVAMPTSFDFGDLHNPTPHVLSGYTKGAIGPHNAIRIFTTNGNNFV